MKIYRGVKKFHIDLSLFRIGLNKYRACSFKKERIDYLKKVTQQTIIKSNLFKNRKTMRCIKPIFLLTTFLMANIGLGHAHALYIDTEDQGTRGKTQEVKVYYSEFADGTVEKVADWYSNVADFELWLVGPDGQRTQLTTTAKEDHFTASFVPEEKGTYRLEISHTAEDPGDKTAYQFNAFAQVWVGKSHKILPVTGNGPELVLIQTSKNNSKTKIFKTYFKGAPKGEISATLFLPSGETKTVKSNSDGVILLSVAEKGTYFLEATTYHENEAGSTQKAAFESVWRCATQKFEI